MKFFSSKRFQGYTLLAFILMLASCGGGSGKKETTADEEFSKVKEEITSDIDAYVKDLPPPSEVPFLLMATGSDFNPDLVNSLDKAETYTGIDAAALNLGVYATDIGYLSSYDKSDEVYSGMEVCQRLAETIGVASAIDLDLLTRFEENIGNRDSLAILIDEVMEVTKVRLENLDRINLAAIAIAGSFVEGLYISTGVIETYPEDLLPEASRNLILEPLVRIVIDQKKSLKDLLKLLKEVPQNETIEVITEKLTEIEKIYAEDLGEVEEKIASNTGGYQLTKELLTRLTAKVKDVRTFVVE